MHSILRKSYSSERVVEAEEVEEEVEAALRLLLPLPRHHQEDREVQDHRGHRPLGAHRVHRTLAGQPQRAAVQQDHMEAAHTTEEVQQYLMALEQDLVVVSPPTL